MIVILFHRSFVPLAPSLWIRASEIHISGQELARSGREISHLIHASLDPLESTSQTASRSIQPFSHSSWQRVSYTLQSAAHWPLKIAPSHGGSGPPHLIHASLGPPESTVQTTCQSVQGSRSWRVRGKIIRSVLCNIVCNNCAQCNAHTYEQT